MNDKRRILVTGSGRGIGRATALRLARPNDEVVVHYASREEAAKSTAAELEGKGCRVSVFRSDFREQGGPEALAQHCLSEIGGIDVLVNSAGEIVRPGEWNVLTAQAIEQTLAMHVVAPMLLCQALAPGMTERGYGRIVNIVSTYGMLGTAGVAAYTASKAALQAYSMGLAREIGAPNVTVNAIAPGNVDTEMTAGAGQDVLDWVASTTPAGRLASPDEIAEAVAFMVDNPYINGSCLVVDGGQLLNI